MRIVTKRALRVFWERHPQAQEPLASWYKNARQADWKNFAGVRADYNSADYSGQFTIFDIGGNKYRLIVAIHYNTGMIFIRHVFTHAEYDRWNAARKKRKKKGNSMGARQKTNRYFELMEMFQPRPIRSERDLDRAQKVVNELLDSDDLDRDERDYLEVLGTLIEAYEEEHETITDVSDIAMLSHLIEARGVTQRSVAEGAGLPESTISDLLAGRREFNRGHIAKLAAYFKVSPAVFFGLREAVEA